MHVILADSIDGGIFAFLVLIAGFAASLLALGALVPALRGNKALTLVLVLPAFIAGLAVTCWMGAGYIKDGLHNPDYDLVHDFLMPWILLAGAPFGTALLSIFILWYERRKPAQTVVQEPEQ